MSALSQDSTMDEQIETLWVQYRDLLCHIFNRRLQMTRVTSSEIKAVALEAIWSTLLRWDGERDLKPLLAKVAENMARNEFKLWNRRKNRILTDAVSLDEPLENKDGKHVRPKHQVGYEVDHVDLMWAAELRDLIMSRLTPLELAVLEGYLGNRSQSEMATIFGYKTTKPIDNALMRIRRKTQRVLNELEVQG